MEYIEKMRATLPEEVGRAKMIASNKERVIREAQERAQQIVTEANSAHSQMIDQSEVMRQARTTAEIVLREAEEKARKIRQGADAYAAQVLAELEARLTTAIGSVKMGQEALAGLRNAVQQQPPQAQLEARKLGAAAPPAPPAGVQQQAVNPPPSSLTADGTKPKRAAFDAQEDTATLESLELR
jgi:vacuolar-type H+-ATPase subunit H